MQEEAEYLSAVLGGSGTAQLPQSFSLAQNFPNPFNPSTAIRFDIPASAGQGVRVSLSVYDLRGARVAQLVDEEKAPGSHLMVWDGSDSQGRPLASGVYFYRLRAGDFVCTRKLVLLK